MVDVVIRKNTKGEQDLSCPRAHTAIDHPAPREVSAREDVMEESGGDPGFGVLLRQQVEGKEKKMGLDFTSIVFFSFCDSPVKND